MTVATRLWFILPFLVPLRGIGQDTTKLSNERFSIHAQATVITQYKPSFNARYSGQNSLSSSEETCRSITSTMFLGARLWNGAGVFINPEVAGGSGLSGSLGVGASSNGETYRVDNPAPSFELARLFFRQIISFDRRKKYQPDDQNKLGGFMPEKYLAVTAGKICVADFFDINSYSHDPRTQFMSWALMSNGAWDFPANTRGYTPSLVLEYFSIPFELRYAFSLVPTAANGMTMNWNIMSAGSHTLEYTYNYTVAGERGALRLVSYFTTANMGNYNKSIGLNPAAPSLSDTEKPGSTKYGFGINAEQAVNKTIGLFFRAGWNDGNNETWEFTEIDRTVSLGISFNGAGWNREYDNIGLAFVTSGLSRPHRSYLRAGGKGFELGDGTLSYGLESLAEFYYSFALTKSLYISGTYQFINNPGYNRDRGPVNVFSIRAHIFI